MKKNLKDIAKKALSKLPDEKSFRFNAGINNPTGVIASSLKDFIDDLKKVNVTSIEFHASRGDFSKWISNSLKDNVLAKNLNKLKNLKGEKLRKKVIETVENRYKALNESLKSTEVMVKKAAKIKIKKVVRRKKKRKK